MIEILNTALILIFLIAIIPWSIGITRSYASLAEQPVPGEQVIDEELLDNLMNKSLSEIRKAESSGADIRELVTQFNNAVDLQRADEESDFEQCNTRQECMIQASQIFQNILNAAPIAKADADKLYYQNFVMGQSIAILIAFSFSLVGVYLYNQYKLQELKRFLQTEIKLN